MDRLQLCAYIHSSVVTSVHCSKQALCLHSVRTVKSPLFTHSCRILISPCRTLDTWLCHAVQSGRLSVWKLWGKSLGKVFYYWARDSSAEMLLLCRLHKSDRQMQRRKQPIHECTSSSLLSTLCMNNYCKLINRCRMVVRVVRIYWTYWVLRYYILLYCINS